MKRLILFSAVVICVACGPNDVGPAVSNQAADGKAKDKAKPAVKPKAPKPYTVPADAFADVPQGINALVSAADQKEALKAYTWLGQQGGKSIEPLVALIKDKDADLKIKIYACRGLGKIGQPAVGALTDALSSDTPMVRINAAQQLGAIKPTNGKIIQTLVKLMKHDDPRTRRYAIMALKDIGPPAKDAAVKPLLRVLEDQKENETVRDAAKLALTKVNPRRTFND